MQDPEGAPWMELSAHASEALPPSVRPRLQQRAVSSRQHLRLEPSSLAALLQWAPDPELRRQVSSAALSK